MALTPSYPTFSLPFAIWLMMGYYSSIPEELEAAALIGGCNRLQAFYRVVLTLYSLGQRFMVAGLTAGAVKGGG